MKRSTEELLNILKKSSDIANFIDDNSEDLINIIPLCNYLENILIQKNLKKSLKSATQSEHTTMK